MKVGLDREHRLLCMLLAADPAGSPFAAGCTAQLARVDWEKFEELIVRHRVAALVGAGLSKAPAIVVPPGLEVACQEASDRNTHDFLQSVRLAAQLSRAFADRGIACALLKGIVIAERYYAQSADREMIDVDMLVAPDRYEDAEEIVRSLGFHRMSPKFGLSQKTQASFKHIHNAFTFTRRADHMQVDLHWRTVKNLALLRALDQNWQNAIAPITIAGTQIPTLKAAEHALYIIAHGAKHAWVRLKWLADLDRVIRGLTQAEVRELAMLVAEAGVAKMVATSLALSRQLLGTPIPLALAAMVTVSTDQSLLAQQARMIIRQLPGKGRTFRDAGQMLHRMRHTLSLHAGGGYRRAAILRELGRPEDLAAIPLSPGQLWMLPALSPILAAWRRIRRLASG